MAVTQATQTMEAVAVTPGQAQSARMVTMARPAVAPGRLLMRVLEVGIDGTDTEINNAQYGEAPAGSDFLVIGHEGLSRVETVGEGVRGFSAGDLVVGSLGAAYHDVNRHPLAGLAEELGQIDYVLEATGVSSVAFQAIGAVGVDGVVCLVGISGGNREIEVPGDQLNLRLVIGNRVVCRSVNAHRRYSDRGV